MKPTAVKKKIIFGTFFQVEPMGTVLGPIQMDQYKLKLPSSNAGPLLIGLFILQFTSGCGRRAKGGPKLSLFVI